MNAAIDLRTIALRLKACISAKSINNGRKLHALAIKSGVWTSIFLQNFFVTMYSACHHTEEACQVFDRMPQRNATSWSSLLAGFVQYGSIPEAFRLFRRIHIQNIELNRFNLTSILRACTDFLKEGKTALNPLEQVHTCIIKAGYESNNFVGSALLDFYVKSGRLEDAYLIFKGILNPDLVSCNAMLAGLAQNGRFADARQLFDKMPHRDMTSFHSIIAGLSQNGFHEEALKMFCEALAAGFRADAFTFSTAIGVCAELATLNQGTQIHAQSIRNGVEVDVFVGSALIDVYAKCGDMDDAVKVFQFMPKKNVVSWTAMIVGCAQNGYCEKALWLFTEMQKAGEIPNHVTFVGVLLACCYLGRVSDGLWFFNSMTRDFGIVPRTEHYNCVVDMLGRAGLLAEAENLLQYHLQVDTDPVLWRTLLGACRMHGNVELGKQVAGSLFQKAPQDASSYVLLSHIYAAAGRWEYASVVRNVQKKDCDAKESDFSWIQIRGSVHRFGAETA